MIQWKQRLYAFLLRRILGPFLDAESYQKLHDSIDVSLQEGKFVLKDIGLNADYVTQKSLQSKCPGLSIVKAKVDRLEISLMLKETNANSEEAGSASTTTNSSFAWRAMKFGTSSADVPAVSLLAEIEIDGTTIELEASDHPATRPQTPLPTTPAQPASPDESAPAAEPSSKSLIGSYIDAALASLQLTLKVTKTQVILRQKPSDKNEEFQPWVSFGLSSLSYQDVDVSRSNTNDKTMFKKVVDISEITLQAGERKVGAGNVVTHPQSTVALAKGSGQVQLRVFESTVDDQISIQRDVEVNLNHQLHLSVDVVSIQQIKSVLNAVSKASNPVHESPIKEPIDIGMTSLKGSPLDIDDAADQEDIQTLSVIMKQYREAYHLAEKQQLKGGVLIPTSAYREDGDVMVEEDPEGDGSFDLFFDANDQSFYNAASVLVESRRIQEESVHKDGSIDGAADISTKIRFHLQRAGIKVVFRESGGRKGLAMCDEYVLLTLEDLNILHRSSGISSESTVSIAHLVIEDAQLDRSKRSVGSVSIGGGPIVEGVLDIDTLVGFNSSDDDGEIDQVLFEAPCISVSVKKDINSAADTPDSVVCEASFLPLEVCIRQRTLANISSFAEQIGDSSPAPSKRQVTKSEKKKRQMMFVQCSCPSITVGIPLSRGVPTAQLFHRHQTVLQNAPKKGTWLGFLLLNNSFEWNAFPKENHPDVMVETGTYMAHHMLMFVQSPVGDVVDVDADIRRADIFVANGRVEVNPVTPITIEVKRNHDDAGRESFPLVPSISSFKARQEDDDEDLKIDKLLFSKLGDVNADSRKELRGSDPQYGMASDSDKADTVVSINIPEIAIEATKSEMETVLKVLEALKPEDDPKADASVDKPVEANVSSSAQSTCFALNVSKTTVILKQDVNGTTADECVFSFLVALDTFKIHALKQGPLTKHVRVLAHDPCMYEVSHKASAHLERQTVGEDGLSRIDAFRQRLNLYSSSFAVPIVFRSQMFSPMSRESPSILLDYIEMSSENVSRSRRSEGKRIHFTLYHITHRFDVDSRWVKRLPTVLASRTPSKEDSDTKATTSIREEKRQVTKVYVSLSDVNFDYSPPEYFETSSRTILRLGDFRFSSNIIAPATKTQAYSVSLGDVSFHVLDQNFPYDGENRSLCRSNLVWRPGPTAVLSPPTLPPTAGTLLRELGFVKVVSLDTMDAVILTREKRNVASFEPRTLTSLTFGTLSMTACKDSFSCFASSMGELNAKLTALSDADIDALREETKSSVDANENDIDQSEPIVGSVGPTDATVETPQEKPRTPMLDGYEWTTVDHDPLPELPIPEGDEQVARWYSPEDKHSQFGNASTPRIIQQHFPLHAVSDPLSDGDLGASKHAGDSAKVSLKSRLIIHQLSVKLRFFDGYDWPSRMSTEQRKAAGRQGTSFVIETLPEHERRALKEQLKKEAEAKKSTKAQLLSGLLGPPEETSTTFSSVPLPEEKAAAIEASEKVRRFSRKPHLFFQLSANGVTLRIDSLENDPSHRLVSIMAVSVADFFIAETASGPSPIKMLGEWVNDNEHPHDTRYGTLMMKMVTWHPQRRLTEDNEVASDECEMTIQILPMRCILDQRAINFIKAFFHGEEKEGNNNDSEKWNAGLHYLPPPFFRSVRVKPWKLKVDYLPQKLDIDALREGSFVELVNVSPIDGMVITLSLAKVENLLGFGPVGGGLVGKWVQEIVATQLHKFLANARPFEPFSNVGQGVGDLIVLPYEAFKNGEDIRRAMGSGIKSLAETFAFQTLTTTSRLTQYAANKMAGTVRGRRRVNVASNPLPSRPSHAPKGVGDVTGHAIESLARGFQAANHKVVIVPYREYVRNGATGAVTSVIKGVPVLIVAPLTGATEALSYTLLGARNALRPDIRKEEEAIRQGITGYDI